MIQQKMTYNTTYIKDSIERFLEENENGNYLLEKEFYANVKVNNKDYYCDIDNNIDNIRLN